MRIAFATTLIALSSISLSQGQLLVDGSFETQPLRDRGSQVLANFEKFQGFWGAEDGATIGPSKGVSPLEGDLMLAMWESGIATQTTQVTDVTAYTSLINNGNGIARLNAFFNAPHEGSFGAVILHFFAGPSFASRISFLERGMFFDADTESWEPHSVETVIPIGTTWIGSEVAYRSSTIAPGPGFVDVAFMNIVPEPSTILVVGVGFLALCMRRRL